MDDSGNYVPTGKTATTDANGNYEFDGLLPGTYQVVETQPDGYLSVGDTPGTVNGQTRGVVTTVDILSSINLDGGDNSIQNDFAETQPAGISGQVYVDLNGDGTLDPNDTLLPGVTIYLLDSSGNQLTSTTTDANGKYAFNGLTPGVYGVEEIQPAGYLEGGDQVGTAGGSLDGYDRILSAQLGVGVYGESYDFYEILPAKISGYVFQDGPAIVLNQNDPVPNIPAIRNGILTPDDMRLPGMTLQLCDATGYPLSDSNGNPITTTSDANGYYEFTGLRPGVYSIVEAQPSQYVPGIDTAGSKGGLVVDRYVTLDASILSTLAVDPSGAAIVQIPIKPGDAAVEYNFSEVLIERKPPDNPPVGPTPPSYPIPVLAAAGAAPVCTIRAGGTAVLFPAADHHAADLRRRRRAGRIHLAPQRYRRRPAPQRRLRHGVRQSAHRACTSIRSPGPAPTWASRSGFWPTRTACRSRNSASAWPVQRPSRAIGTAAA